MKGRKISVLIEGGGTATAISVIKGLRLQDEFEVHIVTCDMSDSAAGRYMADSFYKILPSTDPGYVDRVLDICSRELVDIYIPIIDYGFEKLSQSKERFSEKGIYLMIASPESISICDDKFKTHEFFKKHGIPAPETVLTLKEVKKKKLDFPLLIKPRKGGRASLGVHIIDNKSKFILYFNETHVIQSVLVGKEFTADCLSSLDGSLFIDAIVRERSETKDGLSVKAKILNEKMSRKIKAHVARIATRLCLPGAYNIQGFIGKRGRVSFTEINPRFAGTHVLSIQAGLNSILHVLQMYSGKEPEQIKEGININYKLEMVRYWNELFIEGDNAYTWKDLLN